METDVHNVICEGLLQDVHKRYIVYQVLVALKYLHSAELCIEISNQAISYSTQTA